MKQIAILDFETTGLDPDVHRVVEMGVCLWSVPHRCTVRSWSILVRGEGNEAEAVNHIPSALVASGDFVGVSMPEVAWRNLQNVIGQMDAVLAHNAAFDRSFVPEHFRDLRPWICTQDDIEWPRASSSKKLTEIALAHGLGVSGAHRALADVELIARLLERSAELGADIDAMLARAMRPKVRCVALTPKPWTIPKPEWAAMKEQLTARGFRFDDVEKAWIGRVVRDEVGSLPFAVREVAA